jgi:DNA-directed RNA polymerase beta subunit
MRVELFHGEKIARVRIDAELSNTSDDTRELNVAERETLLVELGVEGLVRVGADFQSERLRAGYSSEQGDTRTQQEDTIRTERKNSLGQVRWRR